VILHHFLFALIVTACLTFSVLLYTHGGQDDTYITYWAARALADHGAIVNYNGVRLEQSSSLALVLILALLYKVLPLTMPWLGYLASLTSAALTLLLVERVARQMKLSTPVLAAAVTGSVWCFGYWATSGTEMALTSATALWLISELGAWPSATSRWRWFRLVGAMFLFAAVRPETPIVLMCLVAALLSNLMLLRLRARAMYAWTLRQAFSVAGIAVVTVGGLLLFRWQYFHALAPNPALIKIGGFDFKAGFLYLWGGSVHMGTAVHLMALSGIGLVLVQAARGAVPNPVVLLVSALSLAQLAFVVISGGDWMKGSRFVAPAIPAMVLSGLYLLDQWLLSTASVRSVALLLVGINVVCSVEALHRGDSEGRLALTWIRVAKQAEERLTPGRFSMIEFGNCYHLRDAFMVDKLLPIVSEVASLLDRPVYVMTGQAGMIAYYLISEQFGKVKILDLWSLTTRELKDCLPRRAARGSKYGTFISLEKVLRDAKANAEKCGIPVVDVYYNERLSPRAATWLKRYNYRLLYHQVGRVNNSRSDKFVSGGIMADGHIAVRRDHVRALRLKRSPIWTWDLNPP